jgi:hypothetical protein
VGGLKDAHFSVEVVEFHDANLSNARFTITRVS